MKRSFTSVLAVLLFVLMSSPFGYAQTCVELGTPVGQLSPILKSTGAFCPTPAQATAVCDCPAGFVAVGYVGEEGNFYGGMVLSQFTLRCKQLNMDGTLGSTVTVTCSNGTATGNMTDGPFDAPAGEALVGAEVRIGCAVDAVMGETKSVLDIAAGLPNNVSNPLTHIGGTGGTVQPVMYAPNGSVIVGMQSYEDPGNNISGGVAWRYAPINIVACPLNCSVDGIAVSNISPCNDNGTPGPGDDFFTADVTVTFTDAPATGSLNLSGDGTATVGVGSLGAGTHTFSNISMSADGGAISLTAAFSDEPTCTLSNSNAGAAPAACSVQPCDINGITVSNISACDDNGTPSNTSDDTFTATVVINFVNPPSSGALNLTNDGNASVAVSSLNSSVAHTFDNVTMIANGGAISLSAAFTADGACTFNNNNAGTAPISCSTVTPPPGTIPTMSEWGLILFALIMFTLSVVFGTQYQQQMALSGGMSTNSRWKLPFDKSLFFRVLPYVYFAFAGVFAIAILLFGYELTNADIPGSLLSGLVVAYLVQFVKQSSK